MQVTCPIGELVFAINIQVYNEGQGGDSSMYFAHSLEVKWGTIGGQLESDFTCMGACVSPYYLSYMQLTPSCVQL